MGKYRIAMYLRLSKEDERSKGESNSISTQRMLLKKYVVEHFSDYECLEYCDDGFTGTNFNRPGMQKMLAQVKESALDCIIVKDFSRFARDYIELGSYLEQIFPFFRIRFISINDHYDSNQYMGSIADLDANFKSLLYDLYSKDLSQKVRTALAAKKEKGEYISGNSPFGYEKAPHDRHMLLIEADEAEIVREIYELTLNGCTSTQIAKQFNARGIKTPIEFKIEKGKTTREPKGERFLWNASTICQILRNPVYTGDIEYGKYTKDFVGGKNHLKPQEEWKIHKNHHEAMIAREVFAKIQSGRNKKKNRLHNESHMLVGKAVCGCCKMNLSYRKSLNPYFTCYQRYVNGLSGCVDQVNAKFIEKCIRLHLQEKLRSDQEAGRLFEEYRKKQEKEMAELKQRKYHLAAALSVKKRERLECYERYALGEATVFHCDDRVIQMETELEKLQLEMEALRSGDDDWRSNTNQAIGAVLSKELMDRYIRKVIVTDGQNVVIEWQDF